jgi:AcrR family transcriptional regulator
MSAQGMDPIAMARPLRRDAERNRQRILRAAAEVFSHSGLEVTLDDVAHHAGVGVGTVYRRFGSKEALVEALYTDRIEAAVSLAERALADPDHWHGLVFFIKQTATTLAEDRGMRQVLICATYDRDRMSHARAKLQSMIARLVERARKAGAVRADLRASDIILIEIMLAAAADYVRPVRPSVWPRYLTLILDGLRPAREGISLLPKPALTQDEILQTMHLGSFRRH